MPHSQMVFQGRIGRHWVGSRDRGPDKVIEAEEIPDILKAIGVIKKCKAFYQCLEDRDRGKVKHCYENDRRWR